MGTDKPLPPNVNAVPDRHGKIRYRYRRAGVKGGYLPGEPWSAKWLAALADFAAARAPEKPQPGGVRRAYRPRSMDDLAAKLRSSQRWLRQAPQTQLHFGRMIDAVLERRNKRGERWGDRDARTITVASLERLLGTYADRPAAAFKLRKLLNRLFATAVKMGWRADNPAALTDAVRQTGEGYRTWSDAAIEQYRAAHPLGTMARVVLELALNTAARRCNLATLERADIAGGLIGIQHAKGNEATLVELMPEARAAIEALPSAPIRFLIVTSHGRPFTAPGLGNKMREWADEAGLPKGYSLHGLRKAQSRRLAEAGATDAEGRAITGQKKNATFAHYAAKADRKKLAASATAKLRNLSNLQGG